MNDSKPKPKPAFEYGGVEVFFNEKTNMFRFRRQKLDGGWTTETSPWASAIKQRIDLLRSRGELK